MVDSVPALAALRLYLYCSQGNDDPTITLWSTIVFTQLQIFAAQACTIGFLITKRMSGMVSRFGLGIRTVTSGLTGTDRSREDTSSARPARRRRRTSAEDSSFDDEIAGAMLRDDESQMGIMMTTEFNVTHDKMDGRFDGVDRNHF
jgi:hypothetical protein